MQNKSLPTITIGISAYNEERNIKRLLSNLLSQKVTDATLEKIIVVADGCTDTTVQQIQSIQDGKIELINQPRAGLIASQNLLTQQTTTDILVLLDADILPASENFIEQLCLPFIKDQTVDLVGARSTCARPNNLIEKILYNADNLKRSIFETWNNGNNIYSCPGSGRAFSKRFYNAIQWPEGYCEDTYSYLFCISSGYNFAYAPQAKFLFNVPSNLKDYLRQSRRFIDDTKRLHTLFPKGFADKAFKIPIQLLVTKTLVWILRHPILILYFPLAAYSRMQNRSAKIPDHSKIEPASSTKRSFND